MERELFGLTAGELADAAEEEQGGMSEEAQQAETAAYAWLERLVAESAGVSTVHTVRVLTAAASDPIRPDPRRSIASTDRWIPPPQIDALDADADDAARAAATIVAPKPRALARQLLEGQYAAAVLEASRC